MNTIKLDKKNTLMVAHAGLHGFETPNTLAGVIAAANRSYWGIEVDVRVTKDKEIVLTHDDSLFAHSGADLKVSESTLAEIQQYPLFEHRHFAGMEQYGIEVQKGIVRSDLRISTFKEYIRLCKKYEKVAVPEVKGIFSPEEIGIMLDIARSEEYLDKVVFIAFDWENLSEIRRQQPNQTVQLLTGANMDTSDEFLDKVAAAGFDMDIYLSNVTSDLIARSHQKGIKLNVWTVDLPEDAKKYAEWGIDYITSNILE